MLLVSLLGKYGVCLGWVVLLASCLGGGLTAGTGNAEKIMSESEKSSGVSLSGKAVVENNKLVVDYTVTSTLPHSIYVFDKMIAYDDQGQPKIDPATAYVFWEEPSTLRLVRAVLTVPPNMNVYSLEIPFARELKPQGSLTGRIEFAMPVTEKSPFLFSRRPKRRRRRSSVIRYGSTSAGPRTAKARPYLSKRPAPKKAFVSAEASGRTLSGPI